MYTEFMKKKVFELLMLAAASQAHRRHGRQKVSIPECGLTARRVMVNRSSSLPVRSHSGIDKFQFKVLFSSNDQ